MLAAEQPSTYITLDLLADDDESLLDKPLKERRQRLEKLLGPKPESIYLSPVTRDREVDISWLKEYRGTGLDGIVAKRIESIYKPGEGANPRGETAEHLMSRNVTSIGPDDDLEQAGRMMEREEIRRLPVVEIGRLVGVLSHGNLLQATKNNVAERATEGVTRGARSEASRSEADARRRRGPSDAGGERAAQRRG